MSDIWGKLEACYADVKDRRILTLFDDAQRFAGFSARCDNLLLDYSKTNLDARSRALLIELATQFSVAERRNAMFSGEKINTSEGRAVLHTALRRQSDAPVMVDGADVMLEIWETRQRMTGFCESIRSGKILATDGGQFTDVINIGIGGSDLGPEMATRALAPYHDGPNCHFISNVDGAHAADTLKGLDPQRTLVIIASKTFTTIETMTNADTVVQWLKEGVGDNVSAHLAAVSSAPEKTAAFGVPDERLFSFGDWVGGRYSLWGPVGLPIMLAIGAERFSEFLAGADAMDQHFLHTPFERNLPVLLGLSGIWHRNICGYSTRVILPYDQRLNRFPAYLQQLDMESNGKGVTVNGAQLERESGPIIWGEPGTGGQHAFFQLLHQGTSVIPAEFLIAAEGHEPGLAHQHDLLKANCLAQSEALLVGRSLPANQRNTAARYFPGNRPSITLAYPKLTPYVLGQLIALYEHRVFVEGTIWGINSFDQWGVELGKELANDILPLIGGAPVADKDGSTVGLLEVLKN